MLTGFGRAKRMTERAADAAAAAGRRARARRQRRPSDLEAVAADLRERWGRVDGVLHAIAFAPEDALGGNFLDDAAGERAHAFQTSAFSLQGAGRRRCCR